MRTIPALMLSASLLVACSTTRPVRAETPAAPPPAPAPSDAPAAARVDTTPATRTSDAEVMNVHFEMVRRGAAPATAVRGEMTIEAHGSAEFEHSDKLELIELKVGARPREDGDVLLAVRWRERSKDGAMIEWSPSVLATRGKPVSANIDWQGGAGRTITLTVN